MRIPNYEAPSIEEMKKIPIGSQSIDEVPPENEEEIIQEIVGMSEKVEND